MKLIRFILGKIILFLDWMTSPKPIQRDPQKQSEIESSLTDHSIYQFKACPFCVKVRRFMKANNLPIEYKDAKVDPYRTELKENGGKIQVPCLKIEKEGQTSWLYESNDIIKYFSDRFPIKG